MCVRPYYSRNRSVDIPCVANVLYSLYRMKINKNDMGLLPYLFQRSIASSKRVVDLRHKGTSLQIEHSNFDIRALNRIDSVTKSRIPFWVVKRAEKIRITVHVRENLPFVEGVISTCNDINTGSIESFDNLLVNATALMRILRIGNNKVGGIFFPTGGQNKIGRATCRFANNICYKKNT